MRMDKTMCTTRLAALASLFLVVSACAPSVVGDADSDTGATSDEALLQIGDRPLSQQVELSDDRRAHSIPLRCEPPAGAIKCSFGLSYVFPPGTKEAALELPVQVDDGVDIHPVLVEKWSGCSNPGEHPCDDRLLGWAEQATGIEEVSSYSLLIREGSYGIGVARSSVARSGVFEPFRFSVKAELLACFDRPEGGCATVPIGSEGAQLSGSVTGRGGRVVMAAAVVLTNANGDIIRDREGYAFVGKTDYAGNFRMSNVPVGKYWLTVKADGYLVRTEAIDLSAEADYSTYIRLE